MTAKMKKDLSEQMLKMLNELGEFKPDEVITILSGLVSSFAHLLSTNTSTTSPPPSVQKIVQMISDHSLELAYEYQKFTEQKATGELDHVDIT